MQTFVPGPDGWRPVEGYGAPGDPQLIDIAWTGSRFVALGFGDTGYTFLTSADGLSWQSTPGVGAGGIVDKLVAGPRGLVAIGSIEGTRGSWASPDGLSWSRRANALPGTVAAGQRLEVKDVVGSSAGWLAVGRVVKDCAFPCGEPPIRAVVWTSTDGLEWREVAKTTALAGAGMNAVAATGGGFVAGGARGDDAAFWTSRDGVTWQSVPADPVFGPPPDVDPGAEIDLVSMAAGHGVIVVVGMAFGAGKGGAPIIVAWRSTDGRTWTRAPVELAEQGQVFRVAATTERFLATGPSGGKSCRGGIWASSDGAGWTCEADGPAFEGFGPYAAAGSPFAEVAVGLTEVGWDEQSGQGLPGAAWWRPVP